MLWCNTMGVFYAAWFFVASALFDEYNKRNMDWNNFWALSIVMVAAFFIRIVLNKVWSAICGSSSDIVWRR